MDVNSYSTGRTCPRRKLRAIAAAVLLLGAASKASAFFDDRLQVYGAESVTHDSNVFRLSDSAAGVPDKADTWYGTTLGFSVNAPVSRQRILAGIDWTQVRYDKLTGLNHTEHNGHVNWLWQAGDRWSGNLGYTDTKALASFLNFSGSTAANPLTTKTLSGTANFLVTPHWELQAIGSDMRQRNELSSRQANDVDYTSAQLGVNYISTANNRIGVDVRQDDGHYPNPEAVGALLVNNDYVQRSVGALGDWTLTGKSHVAGRIDHVQRDYEQFSSRNYSGTIFRVAYDWLPTAKTSVSVIGQRDISPSEDLQTSFVLVKGVAITPSYAFSEKIRLSGSLSSNTREYLGDAGVGGTTTAFTGRVDHVHAGLISLSYTPLRSVTILMSAQRETRTSNTALVDYTANIVNVSARLTF